MSVGASDMPLIHSHPLIILHMLPYTPCVKQVLIMYFYFKVLQQKATAPKVLPFSCAPLQRLDLIKVTPMAPTIYYMANLFKLTLL